MINKYFQKINYLAFLQFWDISIYVYITIRLLVLKMGIKMNLNEEKEKQFREKAMRKFGYRKGSLSKAINEAIDMWLIHEQNPIKKLNNPTSTIYGLLKELKTTSTELQHSGISFFQKTKNQVG